MGKSRIIKNSVLFSLAPFIPKVVNILLLPIMTLYLTDVDFGIAGTISSYTNAIGAFATLGLTVVLMNSFFKCPDTYKEVWRDLYGFLNLWMVVYALCQCILLYLFIPEEAQENKWWIILFSQFNTVFFGPTGIIGNAYFVYNKESIPVVWRGVVAGVLTILVDFILIVYFRLGYLGWYIGTFVGTFFTNASYWYTVNVKLGIRPSYRFSLSTIRHYLNVSLPTIPHYYTNFLLEGSGRLVMDQNNVSQKEIGRVSIAQQIGDLFQTGITGLNNAVSPYCMSALKREDHKRLNTIGILFSVFVFCLAFVISIWSKEIFALLLSNQSLQSAYPYFILYVMACCYRPLYILVSYYYFYFEHTKQILIITFVSGVIGLSIYVVFVPVIGTWAFLLGHYLACLYYGYSGYLYKGYRLHSKTFFPFGYFFIAQLILTGCAYILVDHLICKIIVTAVMCLIGVWMALNFKQYVKE